MHDTIRPGEEARYFRIGVAEHGMRGIVARVVEDLVHPVGGVWRAGGFSHPGPTDRARVCSDIEYKRRKGAHPDGRHWRD